MHRRSFLQAGIGVAAVGLGAVSATASQSDGSELAPLGSVEITGASDAAVQGEFAYVAGADGFAVVDISTPESPSIVAERRDIDTGTDEPFRGLFDCWVWDDRLVVGGPWNPDSGSANGFVLYDVSDPTAPEQLAFHETEHYIHNLYIDDGTVYLTGSGLPSNPLVMVDIADDQPAERGRWSLADFDSGYADVSRASRSLHDVTVQDGIAYVPCWDAGTWIVDVSDPANPETLATISEYDLSTLRSYTTSEAVRESFVPPGNAHYTMVDDDGTLLAVGEEGWEYNGSGGPGGIDLYDITTKAEPEHLARIDAPEADRQTRGSAFTSAHNFDFDGDRLYTSWYYGGVKIHDVSDPAAPEEIGHWRDADRASFWTAESGVGSDVFVATSADTSEILPERPPPVREALYVFPESPRESPDSGDGTDSSDSSSASNGSDDGVDSSDGSGPGFGIAAAVGGALGYHLLGRREE